MNLIVRKTKRLEGKISCPGSKSQSIRAIILATLCSGKSVLHNVLRSDDTRDAIRICKDLGASISELSESGELTIESSGAPLNLTTDTLHSGNSGITTHFVMPLMGLRKKHEQPVALDCSEQMRARPIQPLVDALIPLGPDIQYLAHPGRLPIRMKGTLRGGKTEVDGTTSQYLSALLFSLPLAPEDSQITVKGLKERPYAEMTLRWLDTQGIRYLHTQSGDTDTFHIRGKQHYKNFTATIPADFSSAATLIAAAVLIPGEIILDGIDMSDPQGDKKLVTLLQEMGADIEIHSDHLHIRGGKKLSGMKIDASDIPDLLPTLAVIGTQALGKTEILKVAHARIKETDRIHSMRDGLSRMGATIIEQDDGLIVHESPLHGTEVRGYGDHRTVMALSLAGMLADGFTTIDTCESISKTFPDFVTVMQKIGAHMEVDNEHTR